MKKVTREELVKMIENTGGKFFGVTFIKKDGTVRELTGRLGVKAHLVGGKSSVDHDKYVSVYDTVNGGYRVINKDTVISGSIGGEVYYV